MKTGAPSITVTGIFGRHYLAIVQAGKDPTKLRAALEAVRRDERLSGVQRDGLCKLLAQDAAVAYVEIVSGKPLELPNVRS